MLPSLSALRRMAYAELSHKRFLHTLGVERAAAVLARRYGEPELDARRAALLHDITKPVENQLLLCAEYDIIPSVLERNNPKLLHALTGAARAKALGMPEHICSAVRWHTTGRAGMTALEKIIYLADFAEPFREPSPELTALRALLHGDLDAAAEYALELSLRYNLDKRVLIHPASVEALNDLRAASIERVKDEKRKTNRRQRCRRCFTYRSEPGQKK